MNDQEVEAIPSSLYLLSLPCLLKLGESHKRDALISYHRTNDMHELSDDKTYANNGKKEEGKFWGTTIAPI